MYKIRMQNEVRLIVLNNQAWLERACFHQEVAVVVQLGVTIFKGLTFVALIFLCH